MTGPTGRNLLPQRNAVGPRLESIATAAYASIFDGVVAVYEKEIELEASGAPLAPN